MMAKPSETLRTTNMKTQNIELMTAEIDQHRAADRLVKGLYFDKATGHGCFIGCLAHDNDTAVIAERFGLPEPLTRLLESIFERLPFDEAADFFSAIPRAIGEDGRDLTRVHWAFLADLLRHLPDTQARGVVADVADGMDLLATGQDWPGAAAKAAMAWSAAEAEAAMAAAARAAQAAEAEAEAAMAMAAYWVAMAAYWAAYWAAARAAVAVARAAQAAQSAQAAQADGGGGGREIRRQRDAILRLIREA